jgi:hypothetical protein
MKKESLQQNEFARGFSWKLAIYTTTIQQSAEMTIYRFALGCLSLWNHMTNPHLSQKKGCATMQSSLRCSVRPSSPSLIITVGIFDFGSKDSPPQHKQTNLFPSPR